MFKEEITQYCKNCFELQQQLDKLNAELEAYKMEAEEGKEINAELKAELQAEQEWHKQADEIAHVNSEYTRKLSQTLAEIKEIAEKLKNFYEELGKCEDLTVVRLKQILQKISEVEDGTR